MKEIIDKIISNGFEAFIVGGYVRDYLLGFISYDIDICTNAKIDDLIKIFGDLGTANKEYYSYHIIDNKYRYDITCYRKELEYKKNKPIKLKYAKNLKEDLLRRDFTINTFAIDKNGKLVDLLNAKKDLDNKIIKIVGDTKLKLTEDKTRILRALRFSSVLDFELDDEIKEFLKNNGKLLNEVPKEYVKRELDKIFDSNKYNKFFELVKEFNLDKYLNIKFDKILPAYDKYGIWAQTYTTLPFSNKEKDIINNIKYLVNNKSLTLSNMYLYDEIIVKNAASLLNMDSDIKEFFEFKNLHSIIDINVSMDILSKYVKVKDIRKVYKRIEKNILEGKLSNDTTSIENYLRSGRYE